MRAPIVNRARSEVSVADLHRLGSRQLYLRVHLRTFEISPAVIQRKPEERLVFLRRRSDSWLRQLQEAAAPTKWRVAHSGGGNIPVEIAATVPARNVPKVARMAAVERVEIRSRLGLQSPRSPAHVTSWFCIRERVVVQVESQRRGFQTVEDRFVLVRARSHAAARIKAITEARQYARPYLNSDGLLVRWQLESVVAVGYVYDSDLSPEGSEVFSALRNRRIRKTSEWHPRASKRTG